MLTYTDGPREGQVIKLKYVAHYKDSTKEEVTGILLSTVGGIHIKRDSTPQSTPGMHTIDKVCYEDLLDYVR
jgi:hypothetical protein